MENPGEAKRSGRLAQGMASHRCRAAYKTRKGVVYSIDAYSELCQIFLFLIFIRDTWLKFESLLDDAE